jgi:hypothetical protein
VSSHDIALQKCGKKRPAGSQQLTLPAGVQYIQDAIQQPNNGLSPTGTAYVGATGVAYLFWHLARYVAQGVLQIPRHLILLPAPKDPETLQSARMATPVELTQVALALCNAALEATARHADTRSTFLEGFAGPLALKCAILAGVGRHEVRAHLRNGTCAARRARIAACCGGMGIPFLVHAPVDAVCSVHAPRARGCAGSVPSGRVPCRSQRRPSRNS